MQPLIRALLLLLATAGLPACGDDDDDTGPGDGDADTDADADSDAHWTIEDVDLDDAANQPSLAVSASGEVGVAYFTTGYYTDGSMCPLGDPPGPQFHWKLRFAHGVPGAMVVEEVDAPFFVVETKGTTLRYQGDTANIVAMSGDIAPAPRDNYCGVNDLYRFTRNGDGSWTRSLIVANSDEAPPTDCMAPSASTYGWVVGVHPALAFSATGQVAIAWRDTHAGTTLQRDDLYRSDLELSVDGALESIDCGNGAGDYTTLAWEPSGGLVAAWYTSVAGGDGAVTSEGIWIARRAQPLWEKHRLFQGMSGPRTSMAIAPDGTIGVVWYQDQALKYAAVPPGRPLSEVRVTETASPVNMNAGMHASIAFTADNVPVVSHYRCNRYLPDDPGCDPVEDGPVWSWREEDMGRGVWSTEAVEPPGEFSCGTQTQIGVRPDGSIVMTYSCQVYHPETQTFTSSLKMASRPSL